MFRPLYVGHLQVEIKLTDQSYKMCGVFVWGLGGGGGTRSRFNNGYHDPWLLQKLEKNPLVTALGHGNHYRNNEISPPPSPHSIPRQKRPTHLV